MASMTITPNIESYEKYTFPDDHKTVKEIRVSKKISRFYINSPVGEVRIVFKSDEAMLQFSHDQFKTLGATWIAHMNQDHVLEVIFSDPKEDQHKVIDKAMEMFKKHFGAE